MKLKPTKVFRLLFYFASERQDIFYRRLRGDYPPFSSDEVFQTFKFCNTYRVLDRSSQFLVKEVIQKGPQDTENLFFRIILFKIFNIPVTWNLLLREFGDIVQEEFSFKRYNKVMTRHVKSGGKLFSAAYMMCSPGDHDRKHSNWLEILSKMMKDKLPRKVHSADSMQEVCRLLMRYPGIADFLSFQYATDLNYSKITDFSEMEHVVLGPGSKRGIKKCFVGGEDFSENQMLDVIRFIALEQESLYEKYGFRFHGIPDRLPQLIDCQSLLCETDKLSRVVIPEIKAGKSKRHRIKVKFQPNKERIEYAFPKKWGISLKKLHKMASSVSYI